MGNWSNKEFVMEQLEWGGMELEHASPELQDDEEVVLTAVQDTGEALQFASERLRGNKEIVLAAVKGEYGSAHVLQYATEDLKDDEEMMLAATAEIWRNFKFASDRLKKDKNFILQVVGQSKFSGSALQFVSEELKSDREFIMQVIKIDGLAICEASPEIQNDREFILKAVKQNGSVFGGLYEHYRIDPEIVIEAAKQYDNALRDTSPMWRDDENVVISIIEANPYAFRYASDRLRNNPKIIEIYQRKMEELGYGKEYWCTQPEPEVESANINEGKAPSAEEKKLTVEEQMQQALKIGDYTTYKRLFDTLPPEEKINSILGVQARYRAEKRQDNKGSRGTRITDLLEKQGLKVETISIKDLMSENSTEQESKKDNVTPEGTELPEEMRIRMETLKQRELERLSQNTGEIDYPLALDSNATLEEVIDQILDVERNYRMQQSDSTPLAKRNSDLQHEEKIASMIKHIEKEITGQEQSIDD